MLDPHPFPYSLKKEEYLFQELLHLSVYFSFFSFFVLQLFNIFQPMYCQQTPLYKWASRLPA
uniref:Uncharacterized protein n=1 Tax=Anguilla anguilla TaxID=7936 RepID=A0A0E9QDT1_ANGAN